MTSIYWWQGSLEQAREAVLILKTRAELVERLIARIKDLHSYECPCVVALPIAAATPTTSIGSLPRPCRRYGS